MQKWWMKSSCLLIRAIQHDNTCQFSSSMNLLNLLLSLVYERIMACLVVLGDSLSAENRAERWARHCTNQICAAFNSDDRPCHRSEVVLPTVINISHRQHLILVTDYLWFLIFWNIPGWSMAVRIATVGTWWPPGLRNNVCDNLVTFSGVFWGATLQWFLEGDDWIFCGERWWLHG